MARKTKPPEERRAEIIQAAKELFEEKGYQATQISDITNKIGVAHGLVYHYVKSKSELLDAVVEEWAKEILADLMALMKDNAISAADRLERMFQFTSNMLKKDAALIKTIHLQENEEIHKRIGSAGIRMILPQFKELIERGNADGSFNCAYPEETAKFCLYGWQSIDSSMSDEERVEKLKYFYRRILGIV